PRERPLVPEPQVRGPVTRLAVRTPDEQVVRVDVPFDEAARPTQQRYAANGSQHPGHYNAFDQLHDGTRLAGLAYEVSHHASFGFFLVSIEGLPAAQDAFWELSYNGQPAETGMDAVEVRAGDTLTWRLTTVAPPADAASLTVDAVPPATTGRVTVTGSAPEGAVVTAAVEDAAGPALQVARDGSRWSVSFEPEHGRSTLVVRADGGAAGEARVPIVRLAESTVEVVYSAAVPPRPSTRTLVAYDPEAFASAPLYEGRDVAHPGYATVHDLLVAWTNATGTPVRYDYFSSLGYSPSAFDGVGQPVTSSAPPYWCYQVNGRSAEFGISLQAVRPGDVVRWEYGACMM
ncbi:MAG TPA: DUF4430 domain-containing protein, partial [Candidatus Thermoplasmatota archaeon]|nr:DUF4430 domain-containing protein [Candidatus Thermoplasmatota archaeon]